MLAATAAVMRLVHDEGLEALVHLNPAAREWLEKKPADEVSGWKQADLTETISLITVAQRFLSVDHDYFKQYLELAIPFIRSVRSTFAGMGWLSFDGLLACTRSLLWEHPNVRDQIKQDYRAVLIDEFQDTDPVQYETGQALHRG
jgi:ATP-dependent helicase/nuclease subunit A